MKFRLLERNYWGDCDTWRGRKLKYKVDIETPFRSNHKEFGLYSYVIKTPYDTFHSTTKSKQYFRTLNECIEYVEDWINKDCSNKN